MAMVNENDELVLTAEDLEEILQIARAKDVNIFNLTNPGQLHRARREIVEGAGTLIVVPSVTETGRWESWCINMGTETDPAELKLMGTVTLPDGTQKQTIDMEDRMDLLALTHAQYFKTPMVRELLGITPDNEYEYLVHMFADAEAGPEASYVVIRTTQDALSALYLYYKLANAAPDNS